MRNALLIAAATSLAVPAPAAAERASELSQIRGMSAGSGESALRSRGFAHVATNTKLTSYNYSYWWKSQDRSCIQVVARYGRIEDVSDASGSDCHHGGDGDAAAAVGVIAGAAILGALLGHKSNHHDNGQHYPDRQSEQQYERGYTDGLYNAAYHNYDRSDSYSSGYSAGVNQRNANLANHSGQGGYTPSVPYYDLRGARTSDGMEELARRGFRQVDSFSGGGVRYSVQWQQQTRQCVQVSMTDGRFYDITDLGRHPRCR